MTEVLSSDGVSGPGMDGGVGVGAGTGNGFGTEVETCPGAGGGVLVAGTDVSRVGGGVNGAGFAAGTHERSSSGTTAPSRIQSVRGLISIVLGYTVDAVG
ncbi:hypothetical protein ACFLRP_04510 [Bacteroidota bacterium]